jgi:transposase
MAIVDAGGVPVAIGIASGSSHETQLVAETLGQKFVRGRLYRLIGDKAYDSNVLDKKMRKRGIDMIAPHKSNNVNKTQDGRKLRRYRRRWLVEQFFSLLVRFRRLVTRYEVKDTNFLAFVQFGVVCILLRRFWDGL